MPNDSIPDPLAAWNDGYQKGLAEATPAPLDFEAMRREKEWPTPNHMRRAADGLDMLAIPKYGDVLRWMADACDGALEGQPAAEEPE